MFRRDKKRTGSAESKKRTLGEKFSTLQFYLYLLLDIKAKVILFISNVRYKSKNNAKQKKCLIYCYYLLFWIRHI
jgi:hypothetical protein